MYRTAYFHLPFTRQQVFLEHPSETSGPFFEVRRSDRDTEVWLGQLYIAFSTCSKEELARIAEGERLMRLERKEAARL